MEIEILKRASAYFARENVLANPRRRDGRVYYAAVMVVDALQVATWRRRPEPGTGVHADRGSAAHVLGVRLPAARSGTRGPDGPSRLVRRLSP